MNFLGNFVTSWARGSRARCAVIAASALALSSGCALQPGTGSEGDGTQEVTPSKVDQPVFVSCSTSAYTSCTETVDPSGTITVRTYLCPWSASDEHPVATCAVEPGFVLVSGGAEIEGLDTAVPGAFLTASFPPNGPNNGNQVGSTWLARSSDNVQVFSHRLRAYAVGLKLAGVTAASLTNQIFYRVAESAAASHAPTVTATDTRTSDLIIGGGAETVGTGQYLTGSYPDGSHGWIGSSKDHSVSAPQKVESFVIGIPPCPTGYTGGCLALKATPVVENTDTGYWTSVFTASSPWVGVGVGGRATYNGFGRMIADLTPIISSSLTGALLITNDHLQSDTGTNSTYQISLRKQ